MLRLDDVHVHIGKLHILQGVSLTVNAGECAALLGRNGVGKTTTLRAIMGLTPRSRGTVEFDGFDLSREEAEALVMQARVKAGWVNEADLAPAYVDDGDVCRLIETIPDRGGNPYENLVHKVTTAEFESLQTDFRKFLGHEQRLKSLFTCYANGIWLPRDVASRLHLSASATRNLQKRLKRRFQHFLEQQSHVE